MFMNPPTGQNTDYVDKVFMPFYLLFAKVISPKAKKFAKLLSVLLF